MTASPDVKEAVERAKNTLRYDQELVPAERPPGPMTWRKTPWRTISAEDLELILSDHARLSRLVEDAGEALEPFRLVIEHDTGEDEADEDSFRNASREYARAPRITVGHLRRAAQAHKAIKEGGE